MNNNTMMRVVLLASALSSLTLHALAYALPAEASSSAGDAFDELFSVDRELDLSSPDVDAPASSSNKRSYSPLPLQSSSGSGYSSRHSPLAPQPPRSVTPFLLLHLIRLVLYEHGVEYQRVDDVISEIAARLGSRRTSAAALKRAGWSRFSVQPRFSAFGTKLVPNRNNGQKGGTLLRYGRSTRHQLEH